MVELVCEICYYKGDKTEFEASSEFSDPSMGTRILEYTCIICYCDL